MKRLFIILLSVVCVTAAGAQEKAKAIFGATLVNQYIWRGQDLGNVCVQPTVGVEYKGLSFSTWGSVGFNSNDTKELDLLLSYSIKGFNIAVTDYWLGQGKYFLYTNDKTTHVFEANVGYDFGYVSVQWYTNFAGDDGTNKGGHRAYSSYFELSAPFHVLHLDWKATVGFVPYATSYYDADGFCVTNVELSATKDFVIKEKYHIPVFVGVTANPHADKVYLLCGVSFSL